MKKKPLLALTGPTSTARCSAPTSVPGAPERGAARRVALAMLLAVGAAGAAQPGAPSPNGPAARPGFAQAPLPLAASGSLSGFQAAASEVVANQPLVFRLAGQGHCEIKLDGGDGYSQTYQGQLPFEAAYTYGTGSMSSFQAFKVYSASVQPLGNCKLAKALAPVKVTVNNPAPQGVPASGAQAPLISAAVKTRGVPPVAATLLAIAAPPARPC